MHVAFGRVGLYQQFNFGDTNPQVKDSFCTKQRGCKLQIWLKTADYKWLM